MKIQYNLLSIDIYGNTNKTEWKTLAQAKKKAKPLVERERVAYVAIEKVELMEVLKEEWY